MFLASAMAIPALVSGCGSSRGTKMVPPPTVAISASPTSVTAGATVTLTVTASNASKVTVTGSDGSSFSLGVSGGTQSVTPSATVTYTATALGTGGVGPATATATVTVGAPNPPTVTISAKPASITAGSASTLTVAATNATQVTVVGSDGSSYALAQTGGVQTVSPTATTTYTATATSAGGANVSAQTTVTVTALSAAPTATITANPATIASGGSSTLTVTATKATQVVLTGSDGSSYTLTPTGGTQSVSPATTTIYTATATGATGATGTATTSVTVTTGNEQEVSHVILMLQENHTFDNYFGMLNSYRQSQGWNIGADGNTYNVDGIADKTATISNKDDEGDTYSLFKFSTTCIDDETSAWLASFGDVNRYDFSTTRAINMDGFVHNAEGYAKSCAASGSCSGQFTDTTGQRSMGYYDQGYLNYYYYMASQFALSDRWFSPVASKSVSNRLAVFTGGTTQGLVKDPSQDDHLGQLTIPTIFSELDASKVSWKIYYTDTQGFCYADASEGECTSGGANANFPAIWFTYFTYSTKYLYLNPTKAACTGNTQPSSVVGDSSNSFCIDPTHVAPLTQYYTDVQNGTLPSFAFIESGSGLDDEHPGSTQSILKGQAAVAKIINALMASPSWTSSVFFLSYDEGGGPYDHVPPVPGHSNDLTDAPDRSLYPDITSIAVNPDSYNPCLNTNAAGQPTLPHCDLAAGDPGTAPTDAAAQQGFAAQLGFRLPNLVVSPFTRAHYVSHIPMDTTAVIKFVENRFIGSSAHLTNRDAAQPTLLDFFDFTTIPWATPPTPPAPTPNSSSDCHPGSL
jgi:phospholipase C